MIGKDGGRIMEYRKFGNIQGLLEYGCL